MNRRRLATVGLTALAACLFSEGGASTGGWMEGRVVEADTRRPVASASLTLFTRDVYGRPSSAGGLPVVTDENGRFRIPDLAPGSYFLRAAPPVQQTTQYPQQALLPTYFPSSREIASAEPVEISPGQVRTGVEIALVRGPVYRVRGVVQAAGKRPPPSDLMLALLPKPGHDPSDFRSLETLAETVGGDRGVAAGGAFELVGVAPGDYELVAFSRLRRNDATGRIRVQVRQADVSGLVVPLRGPAEVFGVVRFPDERGRRLSGPVQLRLLPTEEDALTGAQYAYLRPGGFFELGSVLPGRYCLDLGSGAPVDAYVSSLRVEGVEVRGPLLDLSEVPEVVKLEILLDPNGAALAGTVTDGGRPAAQVPLDLLPEDPRSGPPLCPHTTVSGEDGRFEFRGLAPGAYQIYAWAAPRLGVLPDALLVERFRAQATRVEVRADSAQTVETAVLRPQP